MAQIPTVQKRNKLHIMNGYAMSTPRPYCRICGAVLENPTLHRKWHEYMENLSGNNSRVAALIIEAEQEFESAQIEAAG